MDQFVNSPQTYDYETEFFIKNKNKHPKKQPPGDRRVMGLNKLETSACPMQNSPGPERLGG